MEAACRRRQVNVAKIKNFLKQASTSSASFHWIPCDSAIVMAVLRIRWCTVAFQRCRIAVVQRTWELDVFASYTLACIEKLRRTRRPWVSIATLQYACVAVSRLLHAGVVVDLNDKTVAVWRLPPAPGIRLCSGSGGPQMKALVLAFSVAAAEYVVQCSTSAF